MHHVVPPAAELLCQTTPQPPAGGNARNTRIRLDHAAGTDAPDERRIVPWRFHVRGIDLGDVTAGVKLEREMVSVFGDAADLRIIVFSHQGDAHGFPLTHGLSLGGGSCRSRRRPCIRRSSEIMRPWGRSSWMKCPAPATVSTAKLGRERRSNSTSSGE